MLFFLYSVWIAPAGGFVVIKIAHRAKMIFFLRNKQKGNTLALPHWNDTEQNEFIYLTLANYKIS